MTPVIGALLILQWDLGAYVIHEPHVSFPDQKSDYYEEEIGGRQLGKGVKAIVDQTGEVWDDEPEGRNADELDYPVV